MNIRGSLPARRGLSAVTLLLLSVATVRSSHAQVTGDIEPIDPPGQGFYSKQLLARGIPIMAHADVSDAALNEAARRIDRQLARAPAIAANLRRLGAQMHIIGKDQQTSDLPEYRHLRGQPFEGDQTIDERGRGYGGLFASCSEENLLLFPSDRFREHRDICTHEFAHTIFEFGVSRDIRDQVEAQRQQSLAAGKWSGAFAAGNAGEFFAELSMWYFGSRGDYGSIRPPPSPGPHWLRAYDRDAYALLDAIYSGRLKPAKARVRDLTPLPPEAEGRVRSKSDQPDTDVIFINKRAEPVRLYWLDFEGKRRSYGVVPPGGARSQSTFATHAWLLEGEDGQVLGIYVPDGTLGRVTVAE